MSSFFFVILAHPVIQRSIATKDLNTSTNSPLERGRGVLECIELCILRFAHDTPLPLSRGELVDALRSFVAMLLWMTGRARMTKKKEIINQKS